MNSNSHIYTKFCQCCNNPISENDLECPFCGCEVDIDEEFYSNYPWALVYTTNTLIEAEMYKANLEGAGIPVNILSQVDTSRMFTVGGLAIVKIYVKSPFVTLAEQIIKEINSSVNHNSN